MTRAFIYSSVSAETTAFSIFWPGPEILLIVYLVTSVTKLLKLKNEERRAKKLIFILVIKTLKNPLEKGKKLPQRELLWREIDFVKAFTQSFSKLFTKHFSKHSSKHFSKHFHKKFQINSGDGIQDTTQEYKRSTVAHCNQFFSSHHQSNIWSALLSNTPILYPSAF